MEKVLVALKSDSQLFRHNTYEAEVLQIYPSGDRKLLVHIPEQNTRVEKIVSSNMIIGNRLDVPTSKVFYTNNMETKGLLGEGPIVKYTSSGMGTGIYGLYSVDKNTMTKWGYRQITCSNPLMIQDEYHSDSLTAAALTTNIYIDGVVNGDPVISSTVKVLEEKWRIFFQRSNVIIEDFPDILNEYIEYYRSNRGPGNLLYQFTNKILGDSGFDGIISSVSTDNSGTDRGCVKYGPVEDEDPQPNYTPVSI